MVSFNRPQVKRFVGNKRILSLPPHPHQANEFFFPNLTDLGDTTCRDEGFIRVPSRFGEKQKQSFHNTFLSDFSSSVVRVDGSPPPDSPPAEV